jgi:hypothetical protein
MTPLRRSEVRAFILSLAFSDNKTADGSSSNFEEYQLQQGELAAEGERFITWNAIKKYPYAYIGYTNRQLVSSPGYMKD